MSWVTTYMGIMGDINIIFDMGVMVVMGIMWDMGVNKTPVCE